MPYWSSEARVAAEPCSHSTLYIFANDSGSIAVSELFSSIRGEPGWERSRTLPLVKATAVTDPTPWIERSAGAIAPGMLPSPVLVFCTIRLPANERLTAWSIVAFVPAASTEMKATRPRPTVSASAVTSVRPGWRTEFSRARRPVMPRQLTIKPMARPRAGITR